MIHIQCPNRLISYNNGATLFLAGGITGCPLWQPIMLHLLQDTDFVIFNPRRNDFDVTDLNATEEQIKWEHEYLKRAEYILFWFPKETVCPITLFEYGKHLVKYNKHLFLGVHPEYSRRADLIIQTKLERPVGKHEIKMVSSLEELANQVIAVREEDKKRFRPIEMCSNCGGHEHHVLNFDPVARDGDVHCKNCGTFIRGYDAS